jgi:NAD(P)-dependent dehydrogenase (short-subunit alcohol dehydrogenase family)
VRFENKAVYVTGGGHGIGRAIALRLAAEGGAVAVSDIDAAAAEAVAAEIVAAGGSAFATPGDVTSAESVAGSLAEAIGRLGKLDVLVATAGGDWIEPRAFEEIGDEVWARKLDVNLTGVVRCIRAALPSLIASGKGSVVAIGSVNGSAAIGGYPYSAAKAGLEIVLRNLAARYGRKGVRFNLITPGTIRTRVWGGRDADLARFARMYPLGRVGEPDDIAAATAFLASDEASWITGITLPVEGGLLTGPANAFAAEG